MVEEARLEHRDAGLEAVTEGWFVLNVRDGPWLKNDHFGACCIFEGDGAPFAQVGFTLGEPRENCSPRRVRQSAEHRAQLIGHP